MKAVLESSMQWSSFLWKMWQPAFEARSEAIVLQMAFAAAIEFRPSFILTNSTATGTPRTNAELATFSDGKMLWPNLPNVAE